MKFYLTRTDSWFGNTVRSAYPQLEPFIVGEENVEINKVYNCDCRELMRKMIGGGATGSVYSNRPALRHRVYIAEKLQKIWKDNRR